MVTSCIGVDLRSSSKFSPDHDGNVLIEPSLMQVGHQRRKSLIQKWNDSTTVRKISTVPVEVGKRDCDAASPRFHKSPRGKKLRHMRLIAKIRIRQTLRIILAITLPDVRFLSRQIQCFNKSTGTENPHGSLGQSIRPCRRGQLLINLATKLIEACQQSSATAHSIEAYVVKYHIIHGIA